MDIDEYLEMCCVFLNHIGLLPLQGEERSQKPRSCPRGCKDEAGNIVIYSPKANFCFCCGVPLDMEMEIVTPIKEGEQNSITEWRLWDLGKQMYKAMLLG